MCHSIYTLFYYLTVESIKPNKMNKSIYTLLLFCLIQQFTFAQDISLEGTIWVDFNDNGLYDGEIGISDVKVYLIHVDSSVIIDSAFTNSADFSFPSSSGISILPGTYYLEIAIEEFTSGGDLQNFDFCPGSNDANDGVDLDDNGIDMIPVQTSSFSLVSGLVEYVDICLAAPCDEANALAAESCDAIEEIDILCNMNILNQFCNVMPSEISGGNQPDILCSDSGAVGNISWFAFIAYGGVYSITINPIVCMGSPVNIEGIQIGIYTDCTFTEAVFCDTNCNEDPVTIDSDVLNPGQTYYLFIDGCLGSVCSYSIDIGGNPLPPLILPEDLCILDGATTICDDSQFVTGSDILFQVPNLDVNFDYFWNITTLSGGPYEGNPSPMTEESTIELTFSTEGVYQVCLTNVSSGCPQYDWFGQECRTVTIKDAVGTQDLELSDIQITPNPTYDYITLDGEGSFSEATFFIYSIDGEQMMSGKLDIARKINVMDLISGIYVLRVIGDGGTIEQVGRFLKGE